MSPVSIPCQLLLITGQQVRRLPQVLRHHLHPLLPQSIITLSPVSVPCHLILITGNSTLSLTEQPRRSTCFGRVQSVRDHVFRRVLVQVTRSLPAAGILPAAQSENLKPGSIIDLIPKLILVVTLARRAEASLRRRSLSRKTLAL